MSLYTATIKTKEVKNKREQSLVVCNVDYGALLEEAGLVSFANFFHYGGGELIKRIPDRTVTRITLDSGASFFLKRHLLELHRPWQQPLLGRGAGGDELSEGAGEFDNYCLFRQRGLATAVPVAMGERKVEGVGLESFLLTLDFSPLLSLETIIRETPHLLAGQEHRERRRQVLFSAANYARLMHQSGLNHLDFNATHILIPQFDHDQTLAIQASVFDLQRVATNIMAAWRWPVKTLAELNYTLPPDLFDHEDRLFMVASYLGKTNLSFFDRLLWRGICAKTKKIEKHTIKRRARRRTERNMAARKKEGPCHILIHDQDMGAVEPVIAKKILRKVPGSREVWDGCWWSRPVIIKTFLSKRRGKQQLLREWRGLLALREKGISAPLPLLRGEDSQGNQTLVMERIDQARSAADLPVIQKHEGHTYRSLLFLALANQHQKGIEQQDLHLGNFLFQGERVFVIDPAEMRFTPDPVRMPRSLAQLATLGALLPELDNVEFRNLIIIYANARRWHLSDQALGHLETKRQELLVAKLKKRLKKYCRRNTRHEEIVGQHYRLLVDRKVEWYCREP